MIEHPYLVCFYAWNLESSSLRSTNAACIVFATSEIDACNKATKYYPETLAQGWNSSIRADRISDELIDHLAVYASWKDEGYGLR